MRLIRFGDHVVNLENLTTVDLASGNLPDGSLRLYFLDQSSIDIHDEVAEVVRAWLCAHSVDVSLWAATPKQATPVQQSRRQPAGSKQQVNATDSIGLKTCTQCTDLTYAINGICRRCRTGDLRP